MILISVNGILFQSIIFVQTQKALDDFDTHKVDTHDALVAIVEALKLILMVH